MKIYTKTGDKGLTGLYGGERLPKSELRIEAYGTIDELNSYLGLIATFDISSIDKAFMISLQSNLFNIGALLAAVPKKRDELPQVTEQAVSSIEDQIDTLDADLEPLKFFILPGGSAESAQVQIARTVCRRAERRIVAIHQNEPVNDNIIIFINRLSDYLFVLARHISKVQGVDEIPWKPQK